MAMRLFAHVLRGTTPRQDEPASARPLDLRSWVFRELVIRRDDFAPWGVSTSVPASDAAPATRPPAAEPPPWADTQPWCHE